MSWLTLLNQVDAQVFQCINQRCANPVFDLLLPLFREKLFWAPLYTFAVAFLVLNFGRKGWQILLGLVVVVALSDGISSELIKKNVQRVRPCNDPAMVEIVQLRIDSCGSGYSFTSSHAANHFAVAIFLLPFLSPLARWIRPALLVWAGIIAFSQVYVGVHYPGDVLGGAMIGAMVGWSVGVLLQKYLL